MGHTEKWRGALLASLVRVPALLTGKEHTPQAGTARIHLAVS